MQTFGIPGEVPDAMDSKPVSVQANCTGLAALLMLM
jgi:hypothetical protein